MVFYMTFVCLPEKHEMMTYVLFCKNSSLFPLYRKWKSIVNSRIFRMHDSPLQAVSLEVPNVKLVFSAFTGMNPSFYWSLSSEMPDLVPKRRTQLRVMVNAGLQGGVLWLRNSCKSICHICKSEEEDNYHFLLCCKAMSLNLTYFGQNCSSSFQLKQHMKLMSSLIFLETLMTTAKYCSSQVA